MKYFEHVAIDFEFRETNQPKYDLVACGLLPESFEAVPVVKHWLHGNDYAKNILKLRLKDIRDKKGILISFSVAAEARSLISLGLDPTTFRWIDLQAEWKMLTNSCNRYAHGKQLIDGKIVTTTPKNYYGDTEAGKNHANQARP